MKTKLDRVLSRLAQSVAKHRMRPSAASSRRVGAASLGALRAGADADQIRRALQNGAAAASAAQGASKALPPRKSKRKRGR